MQAIFNKASRYALVAGLLMAAPLAGAESQCKDLAMDACSTNPSCTWVNGYLRKDGREVSAYCRNAPARKEKGQSAGGSSSAGEGKMNG